MIGAVGTHAHLDPSVEKYVCRKLKLRPAAISTQVLQRDRHAEYHGEREREEGVVEQQV